MPSEDELTLNAFGKSVSIKGLGTIFVLVVIVFAGGLAYMLYDLSHSATLAVKEALAVQQQTVVEHKAIMEASAAIQNNQTTIIRGVEKIEARVETQNIILLQDEAWKKKLKSRIGMNKELRDLGMNRAD